MSRQQTAPGNRDFASSRDGRQQRQTRERNPASRITHHASRRSLPASVPALAGLGAITFDVGGTLIESWPSVGHIYAEVAARHGWPGLSAELLNRRFFAAWRAFDNFGHTRSQWAALVDAAFRGLTDPPPSRSFFGELYERFSQPEAWHVFDDVRPALAALAARGLKLGVISNWDRRLRPLLRRLKLADCFEVIVVSCEVGAAKPSRVVFRKAVARLGLAPERVLHVGDSREMDWRGARAAGLQARLLQRQGTRAAPGVIHSLRDLY